ncbi:hypothetical protein CEXT_797651 [Caerostris extrusa]|uniref:Uncharacterized protein n=1 Tax=Caerostris extrusa TaxID=172846 RepID=A0AAV4MC26_CAEEX|nr:hypothetical protein CEXT_797651 [Caerostris extrusa]
MYHADGAAESNGLTSQSLYEQRYTMRSTLMHNFLCQTKYASNGRNASDGVLDITLTSQSRLHGPAQRSPFLSGALWLWVAFCRAISMGNNYRLERVTRESLCLVTL